MGEKINDSLELENKLRNTRDFQVIWENIK